MILKTSALIIFFFILSVGKCQFVYNYEEDGADELGQDVAKQSTIQYEYNPPSAVNRQYATDNRENIEPARPVKRIQRRIKYREEYYTEPPPPQSEYFPESEPVPAPRVNRQRRKQSRNRQRAYVEPPQAPRVYSPSVFEKIGLGEAPEGIYVPEDSLLNVLKNPSLRNAAPVRTSEYQPVGNQYSEPATSFPSIGRQQYFVEPPASEDDTRPQTLILPVVRPDEAPTVYAGPPAQTYRRQRRPKTQALYVEQPLIDIDSYRRYTDDVLREDIPIVPRHSQQPANEARQPRQTTQRYDHQQERTSFVAPVRQTSRRRNYQETTQPPRIYSPSVFENVGLGEAPNGVYIPEDSLLNILKNPASARRDTAPAVESAQQNYLPSNVDQQVSIPHIRTSQNTSSRRRSRQQQRRAYSRGRVEERQHQYNRRIGDEEPTHAIQTYSRQQPVQQTQHASSVNYVQENYSNTEEKVTPRQNRQRVPAEPRKKAEVSPSGRQQSSKQAKLAIAALPEDTDGDEIPGTAGVDYPTLHDVPKTAFSCVNQPHNGYYADLETSCQVVHLCQSGGVQNSFLCPNGTIFSQEKFACQWWYKVNCADSPRFYAINDNLYKIPEKKERRKDQ
ncbi:uncharacterized protein LOC118180903 [Stegodyphus dumicola]|uniref:uncharacterized protein LOC118180903 n=1 Tax=Stegodyphus dumicola TaxID=202533 RepID=UPI0015B02F98|nr:uncharacterized protein LOC118180903 [Stegodyphus dumicola]